MLGKRFIEYMEMLYEALAQNWLSHFWLQESVNLFDDIPSKTLENMANRMRKILDNDKERRKVLKYEDTEPLVASSNENQTLESCSVTSPQREHCPLSLSLLQLLRQYLDRLGPLLSEETKWCKDVIEKYVKEGILKFCLNSSSSIVISTFEYGGSVYENLKTIGLDENDVLIYVVLKAKKNSVSMDVNKAGSAVVKITESSTYKDFSNSEGILLPKKFISWLVEMATEAVQEIRRQQVSSESLSFKVSSTSAGAKVVIKEAKKSLAVQLIPAFQMDSDELFSPPYEGADHDKAWVKSYTFARKALLKDMDKDNGCRHNLFKVVKTVLKREPTFSHLSSLHMKMAFLWYSSETKDFSNDKLAERFIEFMEFLRNKLQENVLYHFWIKDVNLLSEISASTLENMHRRLTRLLNSEQERNKVLRLETLASLQ